MNDETYDDGTDAVGPGPLSALALKAFQTAYDNGFWEEGIESRNFGEMMALVHSEVSEALEEHRDGRILSGYEFVTRGDKATAGTKYAEYVRALDGIMRSGNLGDPEVAAKMDSFVRVNKEDLLALGILKPKGVPSEFADIIIRVLDTAHVMGIDLDEAVREKMLFNTSRGYKHGGKAY